MTGADLFTRFDEAPRARRRRRVWERWWRWWLGGGALALVATGLATWLLRPDSSEYDPDEALVGEARTGQLTMTLPTTLPGVSISQARVAGRPIVLIDPGHGGQDPGASGTGGVHESALTLALARELRDQLVARGRVRVALTRDDDHYLTLEQRAALARRIGAGLFVAIHVDSAANPVARGATIYSLSDVASSAEAARFATADNRDQGRLSSEADGSVRAILSDIALRGQMEASAVFAGRILRRAQGQVLLRPHPHQFAAFHVLRRSETPAVLVEAGYISNADDQAMLSTPHGRAPLVKALADAIEADFASRAAGAAGAAGAGTNPPA